MRMRYLKRDTLATLLPLDSKRTTSGSSPQVRMELLRFLTSRQLGTCAILTIMESWLTVQCYIPIKLRSFSVIRVVESESGIYKQILLEILKIKMMLGFVAL